MLKKILDFKEVIMSKDNIKINLDPNHAPVVLEILDILVNQICEISERNARTIRHGATFMTGTKQEVHIMGGVEALSGFGLTIEGMKNGILQSYNEFIIKQQEEAKKHEEADLQNKLPCEEGDETSDTDEGNTSIQ